LLLKIALENFLYIFQIGDSKLLIALPGFGKYVDALGEEGWLRH